MRTRLTYHHNGKPIHSHITTSPTPERIERHGAHIARLKGLEPDTLTHELTPLAPRRPTDDPLAAMLAAD